MKIGIDARLLSEWRSGSSVYLRNIVRELATLDQENQYYLYSNREFTLPVDNPRWVKRVHARIPFAPGTLWTQTDLKRMIREDGLDVFWGAMQVIPLGMPSKPARILTVHDLIAVLFPETLPWYTAAVFRLFDRRYANRANRLIAVSEATARDIERLYGIPRSRIQVVYHGGGREYHPRDRKTAAEHIARKFGVSGDYICTVGSANPRKNVITLIEAMKILRRRGAPHHQLLVAGPPGWWDESKVQASVKEQGLTESDVRFLGFVPEEDMPLLYAGAAVFAFASLYEGFGIPLVEAMASAAPVVASNTPPVPEIVGDAAIMVSPKSAEGFADAIARVLVDPLLRADLAAKGLERSRRFRWDTAARQMLEAFKRLSLGEQEICGFSSRTTITS